MGRRPASSSTRSISARNLCTTAATSGTVSLIIFAMSASPCIRGTNELSFHDRRAVFQRADDASVGSKWCTWTLPQAHERAVIGDVPSMRVDAQPYGGVKDSGIGREGIRYAIEDMTEMRVLLLKNVGVLP